MTRKHGPPGDGGRRSALGKEPTANSVQQGREHSKDTPPVDKVQRRALSAGHGVVLAWPINRRALLKMARQYQGASVRLRTEALRYEAKTQRQLTTLAEVYTDRGLQLLAQARGLG